MDPKSRLTARAIAATFLKSINTELIWCNHWEARRQAEGAIFQYINGFYNPRRRHSSLGGKSLFSSAKDRVRKLWD
jgi:putative transposase